MKIECFFKALLLVLVTFFYACSSDGIESISSNGQDGGVLHKQVSINVGLDENSANGRVVYTPQGSPLALKATWAAGDKIVVNGGTSEATACVFTINSADVGKTKAEFVSTTEPTSDNGYYIYYPSSITTENQWKEFSYSGQKQVGNNSTSHLAKYATMRHYVPWYKDFNLNWETRDVTWTNGGYIYNSTIKGENFSMSSCLHVAVSNLPQSIEPTKLEISVAKRIGTTAMFFSNNKSSSTENTLSLDLEDINSASFDAYLMMAPYDVVLPAGTILRITITDKNGVEYYCNKVLTNDATLTQGKTHTITFAGEWDDYNPEYTSPENSTYDKAVEKLQFHTKGNGINVVFVGDGYSERQIENGTYKKIMIKGMNAFLSVQPFTYYADHFDIYMVNAVSSKEKCSESATQQSPNTTKFKTWFGNGTTVGGDNEMCKTYAKLALGEGADLENTLVVVMMNSTKYAGTCWMTLTTSSDENENKDYGEGFAVAYFPIGTSDEALETVLHHEANGHGFGKLDDEYFYDSVLDEENLLKEYANMNTYHKFGWYQNVSITDDASKVYWADFINNEKYTIEELGVYEGAHTYKNGFWRPTKNSIMNDNTGGFNAPSRKMIYYRINKLAYGDTWTYNQNEFEQLDAKWINSEASVTLTTRGYEKDDEFIPLGRPVVTIVDEFGNIVSQ